MEQGGDIVSIQLGHLKIDEIRKVDLVQHWVQERARRLNVDLDTYEIHIDNITGCVTAKAKVPRAVRAVIKYDN
jgi:hypothetical protein